MKVLICGGRDFPTLEGINLLNEYFRNREFPTEVIHGGATGGDMAGQLWASQNKISQQKYLPDWKRFGKAAGYIRNKKMRDEGKPDLVIAFSGGQGTKNMIDLALEIGIPVVRLRRLK